MGNLPFERRDVKVIEKTKAKTSNKFGKKPSERSVKELLERGIVVIDKPPGPTSHQVSAYVQKILKIPKSGHSGTLDPGVTGVLPVALNKGTRIVQSLLTAGKEYICLMHLHKEVPREQLDEVLKQFIGKIKQLPPIKSAVKRRWRYRKIYYLELLDVQGQEILFRVGCQAGTYIRKLCLHPSTEIITPTGQTPASSFYDAPSPIYTMKDGKILQHKPSIVQKILSPEQLIEITMSSGVTLKVTPDHELLCSTVNGYVMNEASSLKVGGFLVKSLRFPAPTKQFVISDLLDDMYLIDQPEIKKMCKEAFIKKYGSIRATYRKTGIDRKPYLTGSKTSTPLFHLKKAGIYGKVKKKLFRFKTHKGSIIELEKLTPDLCYLLGLIASDGNNTKEKKTIRHTRIKFHNKNEDLIKEFITKYKKIFPNIPLQKKYRSDGIYEIDTTNSLLATVAASLGITSPHKSSDILPVLYFNVANLKAFLKGYFDGDGTAYFKKKEKVKGHNTNIRYFSSNSTNALRIHQMLLKLRITSKIFHKRDYHIVSLDSLYAKKKFIKDIGSSHPKKINVFEKILTLKERKMDSQLHIGLHYKIYLSAQRKKLNELGGNINRILKGNIPATRGTYSRAQKMTKLPHLDEFIVEKITKIRKVDGAAFVYDMTVPKTHNFLIETGYVSSNCHDIGTQLGVGAHMAELRRTKAAGFSEKHILSLQDLTDALHYYKKGDEAPIRKAILPIESGVDHLAKIWVLDTTVDALCHGMQLKLPGIVKFDSDIQADDMVAVMTLKDELILTGMARMPSKGMAAERGIAVKTEQVFLERGTYPKNA
ncbi:RNA-guided pseudouridylation complex pseudouridine synthase subunit Cbf5 [Candidatus Woesearchaeota archaeon]|nr:RNA-guided pseudouridylation complex pseudouridine synthase subunit Cbf5 [Candidatus Woesearchaeota archaeon]